MKKDDVKFTWQAVAEEGIPPGAVVGGSVAVGSFRETSTGARHVRIDVGRSTAIMNLKAARMVARHINEWCDHHEEAEKTESLMDRLTDLGKAALEASRKIVEDDAVEAKRESVKAYDAEALKRVQKRQRDAERRKSRRAK